MDTHIKTEPLETIRGIQKQRIIPFLWFDNQAEQAAQFYTSVFKNSRVKTSTYYSDEAAAASGVPVGSVMTVAFQAEGLDFTAINGGPVYKITPAISFMVNCRTREKIDDLWSKLSESGKVFMPIDQYPFSERYGWVEDKFGVSWQLNLGNDTQIIAPCIMFTNEQQGKAEEAINYYMSVFKNSAVEIIEKYTKDEEGPTDGVKYAAFSLDGQNFKAMDTGVDVPWRFNPAISFVVNCISQPEIDYYWDKLSDGADESAQQCGWLADRYGVSWQIVPEQLGLWLSDSHSETGKSVMNALLSMKKLDISVLRDAYEGMVPSSRTNTGETGANYEGPEISYRKTETLTPNEEL